MSVGSAREFATSDKVATFAKFRCRRDPGFVLSIPPAGTLQNWPCYRGIYPHKIPYTTVGFGAPSGKLVYKGTRNTRKPMKSSGHRSITNSRRSNDFYILFFRLWAPNAVPEPSYSWGDCRGIAERSESMFFQEK